MNHAGNLTASSGLSQMEVYGVQGEESCTGNLLLPPPLLSEPTPLSLGSSPASRGGEEIGRHQTRPFRQLPQGPVPKVHHLGCLALYSLIQEQQKVLL